MDNKLEWIKTKEKILRQDREQRVLQIFACVGRLIDYIKKPSKETKSILETSYWNIDKAINVEYSEELRKSIYEKCSDIMGEKITSVEALQKSIPHLQKELEEFLTKEENKKLINSKTRVELVDTIVVFKNQQCSLQYLVYLNQHYKSIIEKTQK